MGKNKNNILWLLSTLSAVLLWLSWPPGHLNFFVFVALIPLMYIEKMASDSNHPKARRNLFLMIFWAFLLWNVLSTWWIHHASLAGAIAAMLINAFMMTLPFVFFFGVKKWTKRNLSPVLLAIFWLSFEYLHTNWQFAWPWLTLGNNFATQTNWVQWYEFTGTPGGSLWIWLTNIFGFGILKHIIDAENKKTARFSIIIQSALLLLTISLPIVVSHLIHIEPGRNTGKNVVMVQPNIDPYEEKFQAGTFHDQIEQLIRLSDSLADEHTALILWPETSISRPRDEKAINRDYIFDKIRSMLQKHPQAKLIAGMDSYRFYEKGEEMSPTARFYSPDSSYYESYNAAILLDTSQKFAIYHKAKLVPGVEKMPYPRFFKFLNKLVIDLGGTSGSLSQDKEASVFGLQENITAAPIICYESVFGDYCGDYVLKGANLLTVITNDGWWRNTSGYKQHYLYAALRAIELRKNVARAANTGVSCYIYADGSIDVKTDWWIPTAIKHDIFTNNKQTFYARYGDFISRIAAFVSIIMILVSWVRHVMRKSVMEK